MHGRRNARHQTAAADRNDDDIEIRALLHHFQADGSLSRRDNGIVIRVDEGKIILTGATMRFIHRLGQCFSEQNNLGTEILRLGNFIERRSLRHDDRRRNAEALRVECNALRMVASAAGDDPIASLRRFERQEFIKCTACLERIRVLHVLELEIKLDAQMHG